MPPPKGFKPGTAKGKTKSAKAAKPAPKLAKIAGKTSAASGKRTIYDMNEDKTVTSSQAKRRRFAPSDSQFRSPSNPTKAGHRSGYHESAVTTDTFTFLKTAKKAKTAGKSVLGKPSSDKSFFKNYGGKEVYSENLDTVLKIADGFRTDTARTILSAPEGQPAGHSGSELSLDGQGPAHDLLRAPVMKILQLDPKTKGMTEKAIAVLFGAITVSSIAPGVLARTIKGGTDKLKSKNARADWEPSRNEGKARVNALFDALSPDEQDFVKKHSGEFLESTQGNVSAGKKRRLSRANTPPRLETPVKNEVSGGDYELTPSAAAKGKSAAAPIFADFDEPTVDPPKNIADFGAYITQPFRDER